MIELIAESKDVFVQVFPLKRLELEPASVNGEKAVYTLMAIGVGRSRETTEFVRGYEGAAFSIQGSSGN